MPDTKREESHHGKDRERNNLSECQHVNLVKVQESGINDVDADVSIYTCSGCGRSFTITDF